MDKPSAIYDIGPVIPECRDMIYPTSGVCPTLQDFGNTSLVVNGLLMFPVGFRFGEMSICVNLYDVLNSVSLGENRRKADIEKMKQIPAMKALLKTCRDLHNKYDDVLNKANPTSEEKRYFIELMVQNNANLDALCVFLKDKTANSMVFTKIDQKFKSTLETILDKARFLRDNAETFPDNKLCVAVRMMKPMNINTDVLNEEITELENIDPDSNKYNEVIFPYEHLDTFISTVVTTRNLIRFMDLFDKFKNDNYELVKVTEPENLVLFDQLRSAIVNLIESSKGNLVMTKSFIKSIIEYKEKENFISRLVEMATIIMLFGCFGREWNMKLNIEYGGIGVNVKTNNPLRLFRIKTCAKKYLKVVNEINDILGSTKFTSKIPVLRYNFSSNKSLAYLIEPSGGDMVNMNRLIHQSFIVGKVCLTMVSDYCFESGYAILSSILGFSNQKIAACVNNFMKYNYRDFYCEDKEILEIYQRNIVEDLPHGHFIDNIEPIPPTYVDCGFDVSKFMRTGHETGNIATGITDPGHGKMSGVFAEVEEEGIRIPSASLKEMRNIAIST
jgi:hypothetical protein